MCNCGKQYAPKSNPQSAQNQAKSRASLSNKKVKTNAAGYVASRQSFDLKNDGKQGDDLTPTQEN